MPGPSPDRVRYTVACACGMKLSLDARAFGRPQVCRKCGGTVTVGWRKDPNTRRTVPFAVTRARARAGVKPDQTPYVALCGCGYRRPVSESAVGTTPRCPGCGKLMAVEKLAHLNDPKKIVAIPKPDPMTTVPLRLRPPVKIRLRPGATFFDCPCGERLLLRANSMGDAIRCPACERRLVTETAPEAPPAPASADFGPASAGPPPKPARQLRPGECECACGAVIPPRTSRTGLTFECPSCGRKGRVEQAESGLRAVILSEPPGAAPPAAPPPAPEPAPPSAPEMPFLETAPFEEGDAFEEALADDAQPVLCECGSEIYILAAAVGQNVQCPRCELLLSVEMQGGELRVRAIGRMDQDTWTLEDFK